MRDFLPALPNKYEPAKDWSVTQEYRERTMDEKRESDDRKWRQKTRDLEDLETPVAIQNQTGNNPSKWDKTGIVLENKPHSQVLIRVDGSRRVTMRNRRFVRRLDPTLKKTENPRTVMREPVKKPPQAQREHVREASPVQHDDVQAGDRAGQEGDGGGAVPVEREPDVCADDAQGGGQTRPKRSPKPNPKYNPEEFDLSYAGVRKGSRRSIRRAGK